MLQSGYIIRGLADQYEIIKDVNQGYFAFAYKAKNKKGDLIFLKEYKDPTILCKEYRPFIKHNEKLKQTLDKLGNIVENNYEFFEFDDTYFQAKEFLRGDNLNNILYESSAPLEWKKRLQFATVIMGAIRVLHENNIVHTDLKPEQIYLREDKNLTFGAQVKLCDFDYSRLVGISEPHVYVTTDSYSSPEYLRNETPTFESDIFTMGIILYELLAYRHPIAQGENDDYTKDALNRRNVKPPKEFNDQLSNQLSDLIFEMLNPDKTKRPTAENVHNQLLSDLKQIEPKPGLPTAVTRPLPETSAPYPPITPEPVVQESIIRIEFHEGSNYLSLYKDGVYGRNQFRNVFQNYQSSHPEQFKLFINSGEIEGIPVPSSITKYGEIYHFSPTIVDGEDITAKKITLKEGSVIEIGALKLKVKFVKA